MNETRENQHNWRDMPQRENAMANVVFSSRAQRCIYCGAERTITTSDGHDSVKATKPAGLSDECGG